MKKKTKKTKKTTALVISGLSLSPQQVGKIGLSTPREFVKQRKARGGKIVDYVEGGYVISRLNEIFGIANWNFQIIRETITDKTIGVYGELSVIDHKKGYKITKGQYGSKERYAEIPIGDTLKAAATDCLKKCASFGFGIALDVYWKNLDEEKQEKSKQIIGKEQLLKLAISKIEKEQNKTILEEWKDKISEAKDYTQAEKIQLIQLINKKQKNG